MMMIVMLFDLENCYFDEELNFEKLHSAKACDLAGKIWLYLKCVFILNSKVALALVIIEVFVRIDLHVINYRGMRT